MNNASTEQIESEIVSFDISDEALEAAGFTTNSEAAVTLFANCTWGMMYPWYEEA
jgi:hypothetical protein